MLRCIPSRHRETSDHYARDCVANYKPRYCICTLRYSRLCRPEFGTVTRAPFRFSATCFSIRAPIPANALDPARASEESSGHKIKRLLGSAQLKSHSRREPRLFRGCRVRISQSHPPGFRVARALFLCSRSMPVRAHGNVRRSVQELTLSGHPEGGTHV